MSEDQKLLPQGVSSTALEQAKLAGETARHYGNLRFTMFTVFTTITGAVLAFPFTAPGITFMSTKGQKLATCAAGLLISIMFGLSEHRISNLVTFYQEKAYEADSLGKPPGHENWRHVVQFTMVLPAFLTAIFWTLLSLGCLSIG